MSQTSTAAPARRPAGPRLAVLAVAAVAAVVVWLIAHAAAGDIRAQGGGDSARTVGPTAVVVATIVVGLLGWGVLALVERKASAPRKVWTIVATVVFVLSLLGPASGDDGASKASLALLHVVVALVVIPGYGRTVRKG